MLKYYSINFNVFPKRTSFIYKQNYRSYYTTVLEKLLFNFFLDNELNLDFLRLP